MHTFTKHTLLFVLLLLAIPALSSDVLAARVARAGSSSPPEQLNLHAAAARTPTPLTIGPYALAVATSEAVQRVYVVSSYLDNRNGGNTGQGRLSVLDARTGRLLRVMPVGRGSADVVVDEHAGHEFVANRGNLIWYRQEGLNLYKHARAGLTMLDLRTGVILRRINWGEQAPYQVAVSESTGRLFVMTARIPVANALLPSDPAAVLHILDTRTGAEMRSTPWRGQERPLVVVERTRRIFTVGSGTVSMRDAQTWKLLKTLSFGATAIAVDNRHSRVVLLTRQGHAVSVLDGRTGSLLRSTPLPGTQAASRVVVDATTGHAFAISRPSDVLNHSPRGGWIMTVDVVQGRVLRTVRVGATTGDAAVDERAGRLLALSSWASAQSGGLHSTLSLIDARTGALVHEAPLLMSLLFPGIAVDGRTTRAFVVGAGSPVSRPDLVRYMKAANSVAVFNSRTGALLRTVHLVGGIGR